MLTKHVVHCSGARLPDIYLIYAKTASVNYSNEYKTMMIPDAGNHEMTKKTLLAGNRK
jgi:hypothetical protein